VGDLYILAN